MFFIIKSQHILLCSAHAHTHAYKHVYMYTHLSWRWQKQSTWMRYYTGADLRGLWALVPTPSSPFCRSVFSSSLSGRSSVNWSVFQKPPPVLLVCGKQASLHWRTRVQQREGDGDEVQSCGHKAFCFISSCLYLGQRPPGPWAGLGGGSPPLSLVLGVVRSCKLTFVCVRHRSAS